MVRTRADDPEFERALFVSSFGEGPSILEPYFDSRVFKVLSPYSVIKKVVLMLFDWIAYWVDLGQEQFGLGSIWPLERAMNRDYFRLSLKDL